MTNTVGVEAEERPRSRRSLRRALRGDRPVFGFHVSDTRTDDAKLLRWISENCPKLDLAAVLPILGRKSGTGIDWMEPLHAASLRFADPQLYAKPGSGWTRLDEPSARATSHAYFMNWPGHDEGPTAVRVQEVLDAQAQAGANVMLSASGWVRDADARKNLDEAMAWVAASRDELGDETMFVNLTLPATWLTDPKLREALQEEMVESREKYWFIRVNRPGVSGDLSV